MSSFPAIAGVVREIRVAQNETLLEGAALLIVDVVDAQIGHGRVGAVDRTSITFVPTWQSSSERRALTLDAARPDAVDKRHKLGLRIGAREHRRSVRSRKLS